MEEQFIATVVDFFWVVKAYISWHHQMGPANSLEIDWRKWTKKRQVDREAGSRKRRARIVKKMKNKPQPNYKTRSRVQKSIGFLCSLYVYLYSFVVFDASCRTNWPSETRKMGWVKSVYLCLIFFTFLSRILIPFPSGELLTNIVENS